LYDFTECNEFEKQQVEAMASMAELDQRGHFLHFMVGQSAIRMTRL